MRLFNLGRNIVNNLFRRKDMTVIEHPLLKNAINIVQTEMVNRMAYIIIDRPESFNAINLEMIELLDETYARLINDSYVTAILLKSSTKNFSMGLDFNHLCEKSLIISDGKKIINYHDLSYGKNLFSRYYQFLYRLHCCQKAMVTLCPGICIGNALMLAHVANGVLMVRTKVSFPSVQMGFYPDAGLCRILANFDYNIGLFFAMTGDEVLPYELIKRGFIKQYASSISKLRKARMESLTHDPQITRNELLKIFLSIEKHMIATCREFDFNIYLREQVYNAFSHDDVETIMFVVRKLAKDSLEHSDFWIKVYHNLLDANPLSLKLIHRYFRMAKSMTFEEALKMDYRISLNFLRYPDFYRGIISKYRDKKAKTKWKISYIDDVTDDMVDKFFELPPGEKDLNLELIDPH